MSQLLIIDVQNTFIKHIPKGIINKIPEFARGFSDIQYLWDDINGQDYYSELPSDWMDGEEPFSDRLSAFTKNYAFLRGFMDKGIDDEEIVSLGKFMLKHNITDGRDIAEDEEEVQEEFNQLFKNSSFFELSFDDYTFYLPDDLISELRERVKDGVTIIGGGENECLKEVCLLLQMLDIKYKVESSFVY